MAAEQDTGTRDVTYNIASILYHALKAADTCREYLEDARREGDDQEVIDLFEEVISSNREIADRAKECLAHRLSRPDQAGSAGPGRAEETRSH